jgi:hypothetical protein
LGPVADDHLPHSLAGTPPGGSAAPNRPTAEPQRLYQAQPVDRYIAGVHAEMDELRRQLDEALRIAEMATERAAAAFEADARLGRALLSTQRAADAAVGDAQNRARSIVAAAKEQADVMLVEVRAQAQDIVDEAHIAVAALIEAMRRPDEAVLTGLILRMRPSGSGEPSGGDGASCDTVPGDAGADGATPPDPGPQSPWPSTFTGRRLA